MLRKKFGSLKEGSFAQSTVPVNHTYFVTFLKNILSGAHSVLVTGSPHRTVQEEPVLEVQINQNWLSVQFTCPGKHQTGRVGHPAVVSSDYR
jgi:hypothetical protein